VLTHIASGAEICTTDTLFVCKYIATRLLPVPQFLLPESNLVDHMSQKQRSFCTDIIMRYRDESKQAVIELDKNCPFTI